MFPRARACAGPDQGRCCRVGPVDHHRPCRGRTRHQRSRVAGTVRGSPTLRRAGTSHASPSRPARRCPHAAIASVHPPPRCPRQPGRAAPASVSGDHTAAWTVRGATEPLPRLARARGSIARASLVPSPLADHASRRLAGQTSARSLSAKRGCTKRASPARASQHISPRPASTRRAAIERRAIGFVVRPVSSASRAPQSRARVCPDRRSHRVPCRRAD